MTLSRFFRVISSKIRYCVTIIKSKHIDDLHLVEGYVIDSVGGVKSRHRHLSPGGGVGQGDVVGAVRHEHSRVRNILW